MERRTSISQDSENFDVLQTKQRATVKWLLSKAYNNKVPESVSEPFYKDNENQEHLKPQLVHMLSNAELYCLALANIYTDPNYHNLNHWGILRALQNKGIYPDKRLTETVLIQTNPLKLSAHLSVMEAIMTLYAKEVVTPDRVLMAVERFSPNKEDLNSPVPQDHEQALLLWINEAVAALNLRISQESKQNDVRQPIEFKSMKDLNELSEGVGIAVLISFYCPEDLPWSQITTSKVPNVSDCVKNMLLVFKFCARCLPNQIFHMMPEDVSYMRGSLRSNLVVFLADLFNLLEIHPTQCVRVDRGGAPITEVPYPPSSPSLKKHSTAHDNELNGDVRKEDKPFVVHRGRSIVTLSSMLQGVNHESSPVAGKPSNYAESKKTYAGRRSRRNSLSDESQLTVENFGGSQDNINFLGRNPDKEVAVHIPVVTQTRDPKLVAQENRNSTAMHMALVESQNTADPVPIEKPRTYSRSNSISYSPSSRGTTQAAADNISSSGLQQMLFDAPSVIQEINTPVQQTNNESKRMSTFATLPNNTVTTWQQQSTPTNEQDNSGLRDNGVVVTSQLMNIRMELEEKRRQIENEKRRAEAEINRQRQKMGKAAFFQAVSKGKSPTQNSSSPSSLKTPDSDVGKESASTCSDTEDVQAQNIESKQVDDHLHIDTRNAHNQETIIEQYNQSIQQIHDMQSDIQRLTQQSTYHQQPPQQQQQHLRQNHLLQQVVPNVQPVQLHSFATTGSSPQPITMNYYHPNQQPQQSPQQNMYPAPMMNCDIVHQPMPVQHSWNNLYQNQQQPINYHHSPSPPQPVVHHIVQQQPPIIQNPSVMTNNYQQQQHSPKPQHQEQQHSIHQNNNNHHHQQQHYINQQHEQVDRLIRSNDINSANHGDNTKRFFLHEPPQTNNVSTPSKNNINNNIQRKNWNTPSSPSSNSNQEKGNHVWTIRNDSSNHKSNHQQPTSVNTFAKQNGNKNGAPTPPPRRSSSHVVHAAIPAPPADDMEPQSISFIGTEEDEDLSEGLSKIYITSGSRTYRIPSPTRQHVRNSLSQQASLQNNTNSPVTHQNNKTNDGASEKGFYISFDDDEAPKRPKPPLRAKKTPKKDRNLTHVLHDSYLQNIENSSSHMNNNNSHHNNISPSSNTSLSYSPPKPYVIHTSSSPSQQPSTKPNIFHNDNNYNNSNNITNNFRTSNNVVEPMLIIDKELISTDPVTMDEMEKKKERIMLQSLQRRQQQEEMKIRKELEAQRRRESEKRKADEKARKKEEMEQRRAAILEQHRIKKALEKAELEGDKELLYSLKALQNNSSHSNSSGGHTRLRGKPSTTRPRPKTIHIDNSSNDMHDGMSTSRGIKGSTSNLSVISNSSGTSNMRRDYYRGSQDCLAGTRRTSSASFISDFGDDSRGTSPGRTVGRRGSYKTTSRDPSPSYSEHSRSSSLQRTPLRHRPTKYSSYQNRQPRKSNSLMNLSGSSCDQDSMLYRCGDNDSGLGMHSGIGTPLRRAPSPGHPSSPSGPGSLPLHRLRNNRFNDDNVSESGSDYCGPRLYKQPTTKSNKGIILNAVEYCVFPGAVNRDAKHRVLDEIHRSVETKHFLILFRDQRCQFRALYSYTPDCDEGPEVVKLYGTGPKVVNDRMFDQFFKYNSGGKSFTQIHTKHLTVTIDAFTIHNSLWQGKKVNLPNKRDMTLVI